MRRRQRGVTRGAAQPLLQLTDPSLEPPVRLDQLAYLHQERDRRLPIAIEDRLRLHPLHSLVFATLERVPSPQVNAYPFLFAFTIVKRGEYCALADAGAGYLRGSAIVTVS